ncbi:MAG: hypothetical protein KDC98_20805 [Planctomycetes bacterium]|nr:hypothetical protein [Planctomycetota bacterium]
MTAVPVVTERRRRLLAFAHRLRRRHVLAAARAAAARWGVVLAVPAIPILWLWPQWFGPVAIAVAVTLSVAMIVAGWRARAVPDAHLLDRDDDTAAADDPVERLGCGLATWLEWSSRDASTVPMSEWLAADLDRDIAGLPAAVVKRIGRRRLGRLRWLLLVAILLLLLAWLLSFWLQPPWPGALGGKPDSPDGQQPMAGAVADPQSGGAGGEALAPSVSPEPAPTPAPEPEGTEPPPPKPDESDDPDQPEPPPPQLPPAPLLQLPQQQLFIVPEFIGEGPTRRMRAHTAEVAGEGATPPPAGTGQSGGEVPPPPEPQVETFERAAERAQQARHVPESERAIVRRFFTLLREAAK